MRHFSLPVDGGLRLGDPEPAALLALLFDKNTVFQSDLRNGGLFVHLGRINIV